MSSDALIVRRADASDVARTLDFVEKQNLPVALRGGGHNRAGFGMCDGGAVIDLSRMNEIKKKYDPDNLLRLNQNIKPG